MTTCIVVATYYLSREGLPVDLIDGIINRVSPRPIILEKMHPFIQIFLTKISKNTKTQLMLAYVSDEIFKNKNYRRKCIEESDLEYIQSLNTENCLISDMMYDIRPIIKESNNEYHKQKKLFLFTQNKDVD